MNGGSSYGQNTGTWEDYQSSIGERDVKVGGKFLIPEHWLRIKGYDYNSITILSDAAIVFGKMAEAFCCICSIILSS